MNQTLPLTSTHRSVNGVLNERLTKEQNQLERRFLKMTPALQSTTGKSPRGGHGFHEDGFFARH
jgi:hypothetical protein